MDLTSEEGIEFRTNVLLTLKEDLNLAYRVVELEEDIAELKEMKKEFMELKTQVKSLEAYGHVTVKKLNDARVTALTRYFQEMKISPIKNEKSMTPGELRIFFERDAPDFLKIWELKNPYKTIADIRKKCIKHYPNHYSQRKGKHGKNQWILIYKD